MDKFIAWLKTAKWLGFVILGIIGAVVVAVFRGLTLGAGGTPSPVTPDPVLKDKVDQAHEAALIARVEANTTAQVHTDQLQEIKKIDDGAERRKRLAELLKTV